MFGRKAANLQKELKDLREKVLTLEQESKIVATLNQEIKDLQEKVTILEEEIDELHYNRRTRMFGPETRTATTSWISSLPMSLSKEELLSQVVEGIRERGDFYFVSLYLIDSAREWAIVRAASGEWGRKMMERGHKLGVNSSSLVASAIRKDMIQFLDYYALALEDSRFGCPNLPETRWELAFPLRTQSQVIGVLEIEGDMRAHFELEQVKDFQQVADAVASRIGEQDSQLDVR